MQPLLLLLFFIITPCQAQLAQMFQPYLGPPVPSVQTNRTPLILTDELCSQDECLLEKHWTQDEVCAYVKCNKDACEGGGYLQWSQYVKCEHKNAIRVGDNLSVIKLLSLSILGLPNGPWSHLPNLPFHCYDNRR